MSLHSSRHASSPGKREAQFTQARQAGFEALLHRRSISTHQDVVYVAEGELFDNTATDVIGL
ncbi:hypothetical protein AMK16_25895 [Streptomyces sp. CB00455]|uniref:hypothetical protein n=1 Tax=Streptomyces sp. CB00455 TaxID=1703927 RepID=UPI00093D7509|nr:hypothetical protein [Streptomyces sp. CB00455]OKK16140.1 hypothetical protein AMK16_25895 [Streptomyces sp. CB00455]